MKSAFDANMVTAPLPAEYQDVHVIASVLKAYLRDLPDPLLTHSLYGEFLAAAQRSTESQRKNAILNAINKLPPEHYHNLRYLTRFLQLLASQSDRNKMSSQNIAIVMSPNLLWAPTSTTTEADYAQEVSSTTTVNAIVEAMVADWEFFFQGDVDFYLTVAREEIFSETGVGFPLDRDASTATIGESAKSATTTNGQGGVSYMQPPPPSMTQSFMGALSYGGHSQSPSGHSHSRSSSHDTSLILLESSQVKKSQSNSSLSDQSSPPLMGSPKLPVRKKHTKSAAPTPPSSSSSSHQQTTKIPQDNKDAVKTSLHERLGGSGATDSQSTTTNHSKPEKPPRPVMAVECQTLNRMSYKGGHNNKQPGATGSVASTATGPGRPIALPRTTIVKSDASPLSSSREGLKSSEDEDDHQPSSLVMLREDRVSLHEKPAIPERPASLMRSNFFKGSLQEVNSLPMVDPSGGGSGGSTASLSALRKAQSFRATETVQQNGLQQPNSGNKAKDSNNNNGQTMLERAHIFNVDKQQVSFIDVGERAAPIAEAESNAITTPTDTLTASGEFGMQPPSPRSLMTGSVIKRPQVPAPPPPTNHRPKSVEILSGGAGGLGEGGGGDTEVTGL